MLFNPRSNFRAALSLLLFSKDTLSVPTDPDTIINRQNDCIALNDCPGVDAAAASPSVPLTFNPLPGIFTDSTPAPTTSVPLTFNPLPGIFTDATPAPTTALAPTTLISTAAVPTATDRTKCTHDECPALCQPSNPTKLLARSLKLFKRFFEIPSDNPGSFVNQLLTQPYTENLSPDPTRYSWHSFSDNAEYASAIKGLSGCTAIFAASGAGVFSAHIWEEDTNTSADLQEANYAATLDAMKAQLAPHKADLAGGEVIIVLPTLTQSRRVYSDAINQAIENAVNEASGLTARVSLYTARPWDTTPGFGDDERGAVAFQFDPNYQSQGNRAYRIYAENVVLSEKTGI